MKLDTFSLVFKLSLLVTLILSFYIFLRSVFYKDYEKRRLFDAWQFPMLLALYIDAVYIIKP
jgi:hypothetical protein